MDKTSNFNARIAQISAYSQALKNICVESQFDAQSGVYISDPSARSVAILDVAAQDPIFESLTDEMQISVISAMQSAVKEYEETHGHLPSDEVFASAYQSMQNMMLECKADDGSTAKMMLESIGQSLSTSEGVETRARMLALILPVLLDTATLDAVALIPAAANEVEIFKTYRRADSDFGDVKKGTELDHSTIGKYTNMRQRVPMTLVNGAGGGKSIELTVPNMRKGSISIFLNRIRVARDADVSNGILSVQHEGKIITFTVDYTTGLVKSSDIILGTYPEAHLEYEVDIEKYPELIPTINHDMDSRKIYPYQRALASDATIQAMFKMQREYGQDLHALQLSHMRNLISSEKSVGHLIDINFACLTEEVFNVYVPVGEDWRLHRERLNEVLLNVSNRILKQTKVTGMTGMFCGVGASTRLKALGAPFFVPPANYRQRNSIHYVGRLFGMWNVYESPTVIGHDEMLCYGKGANGHTEAGYVAGDAISATMYQHPIGKNLKAANTLWELTYGEVNPYDGDKYFHKVHLIDEAPQSEAEIINELAKA